MTRQQAFPQPPFASKAANSTILCQGQKLSKSFWPKNSIWSWTASWSSFYWSGSCYDGFITSTRVKGHWKDTTRLVFTSLLRFGQLVTSGYRWNDFFWKILKEGSSEKSLYVYFAVDVLLSHCIQYRSRKRAVPIVWTKMKKNQRHQFFCESACQNEGRSKTLLLGDCHKLKENV